jgi:hypothetical protein
MCNGITKTIPTFMLTITKHELQQLRQLAINDPITISHRHVALKKLSQERVDRWPNTLQATRRKKERFAIEKAIQKEEWLQQLDREVYFTRFSLYFDVF